MWRGDVRLGLAPRPSFRAINQKVKRQVGARRDPGRLYVSEIHRDGSARDLGFKAGEVVGRTAERQNGSPPTGEKFCGRATDPLGGPGDENSPPGEFVGVSYHDDPSRAFGYR
jgi:hypothetical protein